MPEPTGGQALPLHVVLDIGRRDDDRTRLGELEHDPLERRKAGRIEMFDNLDHGRRVVARKPAVTVHQGPVAQPDALALRRGKAVELESLGSDLKRAPGHVHADDLLELSIGEQKSDKLPFAAAEVEHTLRAAALEHAEDGPEALFVEAEIAFEGRLFGLARLVSLLGFLFHDEARERFGNEAALVLQVPGRDQLALRMSTATPPHSAAVSPPHPA